MSGISEALFSALPALSTLAGGWWPLRVPDGKPMPAGTYQRISTVPSGQTHQGGTDLKARRFQLTIYSERYTEGVEAARSLAAGLNGVRETWTGWEVVAMLMDEGEDVDPEPRGLFRQRIDVALRSDAP